MQPNKKLISMIGLSKQAGKVLSGELACTKAIQTNSAMLVLVAEDASANTKKKFSNSTAFYKIPLAFLLTKDTLGAAIGKEYVAVIAITDENLAKKIGQLAVESIT